MQLFLPEERVATYKSKERDFFSFGRRLLSKPQKQAPAPVPAPGRAMPLDVSTLFE